MNISVSFLFYFILFFSLFIFYFNLRIYISRTSPPSTCSCCYYSFFFQLHCSSILFNQISDSFIHSFLTFHPSLLKSSPSLEITPSTHLHITMAEIYDYSGLIYDQAYDASEKRSFIDQEYPNMTINPSSISSFTSIPTSYPTTFFQEVPAHIFTDFSDYSINPSSYDSTVYVSPDNLYASGQVPFSQPSSFCDPKALALPDMESFDASNYTETLVTPTCEDSTFSAILEQDLAVALPMISAPTPTPSPEPRKRSHDEVELDLEPAKRVCVFPMSPECESPLEHDHSSTNSQSSQAMTPPPSTSHSEITSPSASPETTSSSESSSPAPTAAPAPILYRRGRKPSPLTDPTDATKTFVCTHCSRRFRRQEHLKRHFRSLHTHEKPFECGECGKTFSRSDNLAQHARTHVKVCNTSDEDEPRRRKST